MAKYVQIGNLVVTEKNGERSGSIALGSKSTNPDYAYSVELIVRDGKGKVVAQQKDGWINLEDPRTRPDKLLKMGLIDETVAQKMRTSAAKMSNKITHKLTVKRI
jgi:hypothetical protein